MHFQTLVELKAGAPVAVLYGEPDVSKTTIANAAMLQWFIRISSKKVY